MLETLPIQLEWLQQLAEIRNPLLNFLFHFLNLFDSPYFPLFLLPFIWACISPYWGVRITYLFNITALLNSLCKFLFAMPRPCIADPTLCLFLPKGFGFPSGGAQTAFLFGGILFLYSKSRGWKIAALIYIITISFSRLYLGVHYPIDILGGWILGGAILFAFWKTSHRIEHYFSQISLEKGLLYSISIPWLFLPLAWLIYKATLTAVLCCFILGFCVYFSRKYHLFLSPPPSLKKRLFRYAYFLGGSLFLYLGISILPMYVIYAAATLWLSAGASALLKWRESHPL